MRLFAERDGSGRQRAAPCLRGGVEESVAEADERREDDKQLEAQVPGRVRTGQDGDRAERQKSEAIMSAFRDSRSPRAPPMRSVVRSPIALQRRTTPRRPEPAIVNLFQPGAVRKAPSPIREIVWPVQRSRKSLWRSASSARSP